VAFDFRYTAWQCTTPDGYLVRERRNGTLLITAPDGRTAELAAEVLRAVFVWMGRKCLPPDKDIGKGNTSRGE